DGGGRVVHGQVNGPATVVVVGLSDSRCLDQFTGGDGIAPVPRRGVVLYMDVPAEQLAVELLRGRCVGAGQFHPARCSCGERGAWGSRLSCHYVPASSRVPGTSSAPATAPLRSRAVTDRP